MGLLDRVVGRRDAARQEHLERAAAAVDRELAANLELATMFDQTHQAVVFENGEFARYRAVLETEVPDAFGELAEVYQRIPAAEDAMERRGPAASIRPEDRALIESWEGDARTAQRLLRVGAAARPPSVLAALIGRLRGGKRTRR